MMAPGSRKQGCTDTLKTEQALGLAVATNAPLHSTSASRGRGVSTRAK